MKEMFDFDEVVYNNRVHYTTRYATASSIYENAVSFLITLIRFNVISDHEFHSIRGYFYHALNLY